MKSKSRHLRIFLAIELAVMAGLVSCRVNREPGSVWNLREKITRLSIDLIGIPYQYGGYDITGFDCSGFVYYVFSSFGIELPRTAKKQGKVKKKIPLKKARPADILVFKLKSGWHSGIYSGKHFFIHAPNQSDRVRREYLSQYWMARLKAVIRVIDD
jgi:cell wall-associated NlpC family hydrolase